MADLISIQDAQKKILATAIPAVSENCEVERAYDRILAETVFSPVDHPAFDNSSMDGFAVHSEDLCCASASTPVSLPVKMDIPAGSTNRTILSIGMTARILAGAPIPDGANAVVPIEKTDQYTAPQTGSLPEKVLFTSIANPGDFIRRAGEDVRIGQKILEKGRKLQPQDIGVLIMLGTRQVSVMKKTRIGLFSSGDELLLPDQTLSPGKIHDANTYVLTGLFEKAGVEVIQLGIARDNPQNIRRILDTAVNTKLDLIVGSAGVSVGAFDFVRQVVETNGTLSVWRVNMRPGKPITFGSYKNVPFFGLPGNPVSAYISAMVFVLPYLRQLMGLDPFTQKIVQAILDEPLESADGRECFFRGIIRNENGVMHACLTGHQGSGNLFSLIQANALLIVPAGVKRLETGEKIEAWVLDNDLI